VAAKLIRNAAAYQVITARLDVLEMGLGKTQWRCNTTAAKNHVKKCMI
jgi:hypothetical protein